MLEIAGGIVLVLAAAAVGGAAGWLAARRGRDRALAAAREEATAGTLSLADDLYARTQRLHVLEGRLARASEQLAGRSGALAAATERIKALENEAEAREREFGALEHERARLAARVGELVAESAAGATAVAAARTEIDGLRARLDASVRELDALAVRVRELAPALDGLRGTEAGLAAAAEDRSRENERLRAALDVREAQLDGLRQRVGAIEALEAQVARGEARIRELEAALAAPAAGTPLAAASPATRLPEVPATARRRRAGNGEPRDDLKRIPGIGPATERLLHRAGVYTFRQVANLRPEDLAAISQQLKDSPARLKGDEWITGARREHEKKYGEAP